MAKRLLDYDPLTGVSTYHDYDHLTKQTTISEEQDVEAALRANRELAKEDKPKGEWWHVATIPVGVQYKWMKDHGVNIHDKNHKDGVTRLLNSSEYEYLRTSKGRI